MSLRLLPLVTGLMLTLTCACSVSRSDGDVLDAAETAYACGQIATARAIADSLVAHNDFSTLSAAQLCRLSVLMVHLAENAPDEEERTAMAAIALKAATAADSDTVAAFIEALDNDDRARILIPAAINNAAQEPAADSDTLFTITDDTEHYE